MTYNMFKEYMDRYLKELAEMPATWDSIAMDWAVQRGLIKGNDSGNAMPKKFVTRGELATMFAR